MKLTFEIANARLIQTLKDVGPQLRKGNKEMVTKASRLAITKAVAITPPMSKDRGPTKETQRFAERIVQGDVRRVLATAAYAYETIQSPAAASAFWFLTHRGGAKRRVANIEAAEAIVRKHSYNVRMRDAPIVMRADVREHERARKRGRVPKGARVKQIAIRPTEINQHIRRKQKNIGLLAAGWLPAADHLKARGVPAWIKRHRGKAEGSIKIQDTQDQFIMDLINSVPWGAAAQLARILPYALNAAATGLRKEARFRMMKAAQKAGLHVPSTSTLAAAA